MSGFEILVLGFTGGVLGALFVKALDEFNEAFERRLKEKPYHD